MKKPYLVSNTTKDNFELENAILKNFPNAKNEKNPDSIITLGGDGTLMHAIKNYGFLKLPFFPIAGGTLNFIPSKVSPEFFDNIKYEKENTFYLNVKINNEIHKVINDVVFGGGIMDYFHFKVKADINYEVSAGGLCISTPLGSTAFNLNNGGTVIPSLNLPLVSMTSVVGNKRIDKMLEIENKIEVSVESREPCYIFLDGKAKIIEMKDTVEISKGEEITFFLTDLKKFKLKRLGV